MLTASATRDRLHRLPKAELHVHLDGSLRPSTMAELATERGITLPTLDPRALGPHMVVTDAHSLEEYLASNPRSWTLLGFGRRLLQSFTSTA